MWFCRWKNRIQAHHCDYNKPLEVMWLCQKCHHEWHKNNKAVAFKGGDAHERARRDNSQETLTLFSEDFPAKTCPKQENREDLKGSGQDSGLKCSELSQSSDPVMSLLKTCVEQSISPSIPCTPTWSTKVTKSTLTSYQHLRLVRPTKEKDCSLSESGKMGDAYRERYIHGNLSSTQQKPGVCTA